MEETLLFVPSWALKLNEVVNWHRGISIPPSMYITGHGCDI